MGYRLGVTTGLHYVARSEELATAIKKLGFGITRGTPCIEIALDVPHEVTETDGEEIRHMANKQHVDVLMHGSLTIPMCIPERSDWRDAQDHIKKSIMSSVRAGAKYVDFHACLNIWLELMTYTSRKLTMSFCDHEGKFISRILEDSERLRKWFVRERGDIYSRDILNDEEQSTLSSEINIRYDRWIKDEYHKRLSSAGFDNEIIDHVMQLNRFPEIAMNPGKQKARMAHLLNEGKSEKEAADIVKKETEESKALQDKGRQIVDEISKESVVERAKIQRGEIRKALEGKLAAGKPWESEELRAAQGVLDGYLIMANYLFFKKDPMWVEMAKFYPILTEKYGMDYDNPEWLHEAWRKAENDNDRKFKDFFYGVVAAKYLEGHMKDTLEWMEKELIPKELAGHKALQEIAENLKIAIEVPDARDAQHAGLHLLWDIRQIYVAVKVIRKQLNTDRVWFLADFEHTATQGKDPIIDMAEVVRLAPDIGEITISCHANAPNPTHAHEPLELGDTRIYKLLWYLRQTGFGKKQDVYVVYERGGGEDPFKRAIETLRLTLKFLEKDVHPDKLPPEYFGYLGAVAGDEQRQLQIVRDHAWEPLKDLMEMPDEEFTMLGTAALRKGKRPEQWKKAEFR